MITAFLGLLILGCIGYFGIKEFKTLREDAVRREKLAAEMVAQQQKALAEAKIEIDKLKAENTTTKDRQSALEQKVSAVSSTFKNYSISSAELLPYLTGIAEIDCADSKGSGSLWNLPGIGRVVLTNKHVVTRPYPVGKCWVEISSSERDAKSGDFYTIGIYGIYPSDEILGQNSGVYTFGKASRSTELDVAMYALREGFLDKDGNTFGLPIVDLNYKISTLNKCASEVPIGSPVVLIGFPAFAEKQVQAYGITQNKSFRTITNGIISAHDISVTGMYGKLPYVNYFVSAKIDSGNSGGIAISKDKNGLCVLGVPTWLTIGNYETQGLIQNINNIMPN